MQNLYRYFPLPHLYHSWWLTKLTAFQNGEDCEILTSYFFIHVFFLELLFFSEFDAVPSFPFHLV